MNSRESQLSEIDLVQIKHVQSDVSEDPSTVIASGMDGDYRRLLLAIAGQ